ncbi:BadF/BadG/BcrA/BcrD ATPase family protein [Leifsonia sp. C5G2]|uniref:BadF/BadG/BcrA/BcrD ATPase family protein n=1 Tax=Leifsonia sp. C5G2 TaxID=2735269 RepID=UPI00158479B2|nr:BadF/BadG/BcrA/BcrD ATPase family protein [Leifsonia sp. C5G2]NUU07912.1 hypothetical protein [Leifsonia sp. C5G2]
MSAAKGPTLTTPTHEPRESGLAVAIDGGNSKTEVVVLGRRLGGGLQELARAIGPGSGAGPHAVVAAVTTVFKEQSILPSRVVRVSSAVAGLDLPGDEVGHRDALARLFPNARIDVAGDAVAVLDAGAGLGHALTIVSGAGLNAVARGPNGLATVPALGWVSGDWGGGDELGREAVRAAARAEDGRGPATRLRDLVLAATDAPDTVDLARRIRDGAVSSREVGTLAAVVARAAADGDAVARDLVARAASEAVGIAGVVVRAAWGAGAMPPASATGVEWAAPDASAASPIPPGTPAVLAGGMFADDTFRALVSDALRSHGFDPRPLAFRPVDGLVRALREESAS